MATTTIPRNLILFHRHGGARPTARQRRAISEAGGVRLLDRDELLDRLEMIGDVAPGAPLSFLIVQLRAVAGAASGSHRLEHHLVQSLALETAALLRPTDALGAWTGSSLAIVLQGTGATAAAAVASRLTYRLNELLAERSPGFEVLVYAASGRGVNAPTLPVAALDSLDDCC